MNVTSDPRGSSRVPIPARIVQLVFSVLFASWTGLSIHAWYHPPDAFSADTHALFVHSDLLLVQFLYPAFALTTRRWPWSRHWRSLRTVHAAMLGLLAIGLGILAVGTVDVSGFRS